MNEIWIPFDLYTNKVQENIDSFINKQTYKIDSCKNETTSIELTNYFMTATKAFS